MKILMFMAAFLCAGYVHATGYGFGRNATGGSSKPSFTVTNYNESGTGSIRQALINAKNAGGGYIFFCIPSGTKGEITLLSPLEVPANTTLNAAGYNITLWGNRIPSGKGVIAINSSNVIVKGFKIRNSNGDGIQIAAKTSSIRDIIVEQNTITNSKDGGIDITGCGGALYPNNCSVLSKVSYVTIATNYLAANGSCTDINCTQNVGTRDGGSSLNKYNVDHISFHYNFFDKNLRRNPEVDGGSSTYFAYTDIRYNLVRSPHEKYAFKFKSSSKGNLYSNYLEGTFGENGLSVASYPVAVEAGSSVTQMLTTSDTGTNVAPPPNSVLSTAISLVRNYSGAPNRDDKDLFYLNQTPNFVEAKKNRFGH